MQRRLRDALAKPAVESDGFHGAAASSPGHEEPLQLARAVDYIERNLTSRTLTPASVADAIHVSRSTLYRMFEASGGVNRYIVRARLDRAWRDLSGPGRVRRISEVAFGLGFQSDAHFCRVFRRAFGVTPGQINGAARAADDGVSRSPNGPDVSSSA
jgi:AraC-like DNA-binding protein